jgi:hypothetical protein
MPGLLRVDGPATATTRALVRAVEAYCTFTMLPALDPRWREIGRRPGPDARRGTGAPHVPEVARLVA